MSKGEPDEVMPQSETRHPYSRNLIGMMFIFASVIEVVATVALKFLLDASSSYVVYVVLFIIAFPSLFALLFFCTLWFRRESLYDRSDFTEDALTAPVDR
jgi:hypothetical protein